MKIFSRKKLKYKKWIKIYTNSNHNGTYNCGQPAWIRSNTCIWSNDNMGKTNLSKKYTSKYASKIYLKKVTYNSIIKKCISKIQNR